MVWAFLLEQILREKGLWKLVEPAIIQTLNVGASSSNVTSTTQLPLGATDISGTSNTGQASSSSSESASTARTRTAHSSYTQRHKERIIIIISKTISSSIIPTVMRFGTDPDLLWIALKREYESAAKENTPRSQDD